MPGGVLDATGVCARPLAVSGLPDWRRSAGDCGTERRDAADGPDYPREPAGLQELAWRPHYFRGAARQSDAVARVTFGFYNDQLFRIVIDYERLRTEGMTEADMVGAISETYGPPSRRVVPTRAVEERAGQDADFLVASWEDTDYSVTLIRMPDSSAFRMIVASTRLGAWPRRRAPAQYDWICTKRLNARSLHGASVEEATLFKRRQGWPTRPPSSRDRSPHTHQEPPP